MHLSGVWRLKLKPPMSVFLMTMCINRPLSGSHARKTNPCGLTVMDTCDAHRTSSSDMHFNIFPCWITACGPSSVVLLNRVGIGTSTPLHFRNRSLDSLCESGNCVQQVHQRIDTPIPLLLTQRQTVGQCGLTHPLSNVTGSLCIPRSIRYTDHGR